MNTALITLGNKLAERFDMGENGQEVISVLKATAFKGPATDAQMTALLVVAQQYGLNPFTKELYAFPDKNNGIVPVVGVDGWSRIINEHPALDGLEFRQSEVMVTMPGAKSAAPEWMEAVIYRKDRTRPIVIREYLDEVYRPPLKKDSYVVDGPWQSHPKRFLRHKTLIQGARIAFGFVGIYDEDEAQRIVEKDMGSIVVAPTERLANPQYTGEQFDKNFPGFEKGIKDGKKTADDIIAMIESKYVMNEEQKADIRAVVKEENKESAE